MAAESKNQKIFWLHVARLRSTTNAVTVHSPKKEVNALKVKNTRHVSPTKEPTNKVCTSRLFKNRKEIDMKTFNGKAIYNPSGKANEYSYWACNFYKGCSNGCTYCYLKKGVLAHAMGGDKPELKACFKDEEHALQVFEKELLQNIDELRKHGLFFTFTSDPMLPETLELTWSAMCKCLSFDIPVKILTKNADANYDSWINRFIQPNQSWIVKDFQEKEKSLIAIGFTLTGHDELEPGASTNAERIAAMKVLHEAGFKTFASIEPIIYLYDSYDMIRQTLGFCDLYKIGLLSCGKYDIDTLKLFVETIPAKAAVYNAKIYFKDSLLKYAKINRDDLPDNCVSRKYNLFTGLGECLFDCLGCGEEFDIEEMTEDDGGNMFCPQCWKELAPAMQAEYEELKANGEIE